MSNEMIKCDKCQNCQSSNIYEAGWDIFENVDGDMISELQYKCNDCGNLSFAQNSARRGEFTLNLSG